MKIVAGYRAEIYIYGKKADYQKALEICHKEELDSRIQEAVEEHIKQPGTVVIWPDGIVIKVIATHQIF